MSPTDWPLPAAFDPTGEPVKALAAAKKKLAGGFRWSKAQSLYDAVKLAVLLHVFGRDDKALEVCAALGRVQFDGKYELWSAVEKALVLQARLSRARGDLAAAAECVRRVREAGFVDDRLKGLLLDRNGTVRESVKDGDTKSEQAGRLILAGELAFIIELGGSAECPVERMEREWEENTARLRVLTGADRVA
jgi:hypothetical protein